MHQKGDRSGSCPVHTETWYCVLALHSVVNITIDCFETQQLLRLVGFNSDWVHRLVICIYCQQYSVRCGMWLFIQFCNCVVPLLLCTCIISSCGYGSVTPSPLSSPKSKGSCWRLPNSWLCDVYSLNLVMSNQTSSHMWLSYDSLFTPRSAMASSGSFFISPALAAMVVATEWLGYTKLSAEQEEDVLHFLSGHNVFVSLPTWAGKSLCYLLLPTCFDLHCCSAGTSTHKKTVPVQKGKPSLTM